MMRALARLPSRLPLARFARDRRGLSAVEFALIAPLMIALYFGGVEITDGVAVDRKLGLTAAALANLASQATVISTTDMNNIFDASTAIIAPYSGATLAMTISCIAFDSNKTMSVKWTAYRGTATAPTIVVPSDLQIANTQLVYSQVSYLYTPIVGYTITGSLAMSSHLFMAPRITAPNYNGTACT